MLYRIKRNFGAMCLLSLCLSSVSFAATSINCNDGAFVIADDPSHPGKTMATVYNQGVVDWFVGQSNGTVTDQGYTVKKEFPNYIKIVKTSTGSILKITELNYNAASGSFETFPTSVTPRESGFELSISGAVMPSSHSQIMYFIGRWFFESCVKN